MANQKPMLHLKRNYRNLFCAHSIGASLCSTISTAIYLAIFLSASLSFSALLLPSPAFAQTTSVDAVDQQVEAVDKLDSEGRGSLDASSFYGTTSTMASMVNLVMGNQNLPVAYRNGAIHSLTNAIAYLYIPPASTEVYVADLLNTAGFGIAPPAYAQGLGFAALNPILETWKMFRNIAYFFYVFVFLAIGFAILGQFKIGQVAVTAQKQLPDILVSMCAVTFSYPLCGVLIDVMYLAMFLLINIATGMGISDPTIAANASIFDIGGKIWSIGIAGGGAQYSAVKNLIDGISPQVAGGAFGWIGGIVFATVFALALLFAVFRLFFDLLKIYIFTILDIVSSPITLMLGALPGQNNFGKWIKGIFFNLAVFPTVLGCLIIAFSLINNSTTQGGFMPPYLLNGNGAGGALPALLGMGILLVIPDIIAKVKKMGGEGMFDQFAGNVGTALGKGWTGGELIPHVGFTDTNKLPLLNRMGGLSGSNIIRKLGVGAASVPVGAVRGAGEYWRALETQDPRTLNPKGTIWQNIIKTRNQLGGQAGDKNWTLEEQAKKKPTGHSG